MKKEKYKKTFKKGIDNPKTICYNKEKRKRGQTNGSIKKSRKRNVKRGLSRRTDLLSRKRR